MLKYHFSITQLVQSGGAVRNSLIRAVKHEKLTLYAYGSKTYGIIPQVLLLSVARIEETMHTIACPT